MSKDYFCEVVSKTMLNEDTAYIEFLCPEIAAEAVPGQFVNVTCFNFLRRPFGVASVDRDAGTFKVGIKIIGEGTEELASMEEGDGTWILGPLGNGFDIESSDKYILVGGGTGVFPINYLYEELSSQGKAVKVVQGFRDASQIILNKPEYVLTTDAGDAGIKGNCCDGLNSLSPSDVEGTTVLCVGPMPMMRAVSSWASSKSLDCYVSLEQRMACGIGICLVCVCKIKAEEQGQEFEHKRCCKDGPVFDSKEVIW
ncbi:MAG: dihydroorotate dehydrogenase electron transfer subunit [Clostridiales bacterium]|nr:dihydroorotate dehydrogenase electron transfer subunit [Clostridiales bacterium]